MARSLPSSRVIAPTCSFGGQWWLSAVLFSGTAVPDGRDREHGRAAIQGVPPAQMWEAYTGESAFSDVPRALLGHEICRMRRR